MPSKKKGYKNPFRPGHRNPFPVPAMEAGKLILAGAVGGLASAYIPNLVLGAKDTGWLGYLANAAVAGIPPLFLGKWPRLALGWLIGGGTMLFGRIVDDYTNQQYIVYQVPSGAGVGSFFAPGKYPLPAGNNFGAYAPGRRALNAAPAVVAAPTTAKSGVGWIRSFAA